VRQLVDEGGGDVLVRFWEWSRQDQIHFFEHDLVGADFVLNPVGLGRDILAPGTHIAGEGVVGGQGGGDLVYITVLRNPLDAVVARFFTAEDRSVASARCARYQGSCWAAALSLPACRGCVLGRRLLHTIPLGSRLCVGAA
jgi:hypothetical protein